MVRIIAGEAKGINLKVPAFTNKIRPTADRVKEALFSILGNRVLGARVLDLFCGSGNLGLEALSRGASSCCFVEQDKACLKSLEENIQKLKVDNKSTVFKGNVLNFLRFYNSATDKYNLILADPPYDETGFWFSTDEKQINILKIFNNYNILDKFFTFIIEHRSDFVFPYDILNGYSLDTRKYGSTSVTIINS